MWGVVAAAALLAAGCGGDSDADAEPDGPGGETLRILVANDDGIDHPGMDLMVRRLLELPDVKISVVAPAENKSGSGKETTPGTVEYSDGETASGFEGTAVDGLPADVIGVALDELGLEPHVVVAGVNDAQNIGPVAVVSGTLGIVRLAVERGIPAVAASAGLEFNEDEFGVAADLVADWIEEHREELLEGTLDLDAAISFNVPTCDREAMGDLVEVPLAEELPEGTNIFKSNCDLANPDPKDDIEALTSGYPAMTEVPVELDELEPAG